MKGILLALCLGFPSLALQAREYKIYAAVLDDTPVELSDGAKWMMDKGDVFPVSMFKESQTKVILQFAGASFQLETKQVRLLKDEEVAAGLANYRRNLEAYLKTKAEKWKATHDPKKQEPAAAKP